MKYKIKISIVLLISMLLVSCSNNNIENISPVEKESSNTVETINPVQEETDISSKVISDGHINEIINNLCSDEYKGRVVGTVENENTVKYIENYLKDLNISSFNHDSYKISTMVRGIFSDKVMTVDNVAAVIKGTNSDSAIFVTAHMDHIIGKDGDPLLGAIDNASGISVMLETAHKLSELLKDNPLDVDVVFVAFNAEETGLNGSREFLNQYADRYNNMYNINIDCVGYKKADSLAMGNDHVESQKLYDAMKTIFDEDGIKYNDNLYASKNGMRYGTSDHEMFRVLGFPALVLGDDNLIDVVHTKNDNLENLDFEELENLSKALAEFIVKNNNNMFNN